MSSTRSSTLPTEPAAVAPAPKAATRLLDGRDAWIVAGLIVASFALYVWTMPPSVLDGDSGRWQYVAQVLGIPYPTTYPVLVLLIKLWTLLVPIGSMAFRVSLFSVTVAVLAVGLLYLVMALVVRNRLAAASGAALFATLPTTWWWSISVKAYALNLVLVATCFLLLLLWSASRREGTLRWFALVYGFSLTNHVTMALFAPAFAAFIFWTDPTLLRKPRRLAWLALLALLPLALYLYIPLRGRQLWDALGTEPGLPWPVAVSRGLVSSEFTPSLEGFWRVVFAPHETQALTGGWLRVPSRLVSVYGPLASHEFGLPVLALALAGAIVLWWRNSRTAALFTLGFLAFPPLVVKYGHGMQAAFLLPANLIVAVALASALAGLLDGGAKLIRHFRRPWRVTTGVAAGGLIFALIVAGAGGRYARMDRSGDTAVRDYWQRILTHPLEQGAGILAHSGVLTSLWYAQQVEGQRPDLYGVFPPDDGVVSGWLNAGHALYLAGPLEGWLPKVWERYRLTPWGILVRIAPYDSPDEAGLIRPARPRDVPLNADLEWLGFDRADAIVSGASLPLRLQWRAVHAVSTDYLVSIRLLDAAGRTVALKEDRLVSAWYPQSMVPEGRFILDVFELPLPLGTLPGRYAVQCVVHHPGTGETLPPVMLGDVEVTRAVPDSSGLVSGERELPHASHAEFGDRIRLADYAAGPSELKPGDTLSVEALWHTRRRLEGDYAVSLQLVDGNGTIRWETAAPPGLETSRWQPGEWIRDRQYVTLPADEKGGVYTLRLGWVSANGRRLPLTSGLWPTGDAVDLGQVRVVERPHDYTRPSPALPLDVEFEGGSRLVGYDLDPQPGVPGRPLRLTLFWQSAGPLDRRYTVFVHLLDAAGTIRAQRDAPPGQGTLPTTGWIAGEFLRDIYELPIDPALPPGDYTLAVGLYDAATGQRLPLAGSTSADQAELKVRIAGAANATALTGTHANWRNKMSCAIMRRMKGVEQS